MLIGVFVLGFYQTRLSAVETEAVPISAETTIIKPQTALPDMKVTDDKSVYNRDGYGDDTSVVTMYLTARRGNDGENSDNEFDELARHSKLEYIANDTDPHRTECIIQEGDENGPKEGYYGYGLTAPNATVSIRGNTSSREPLKSYKITLHDGAEPWRSQTVINLNKHVFDLLGFRQKMVTDVVKNIPGMFSLRTQFVHLYVKDETTGEVNPQFVSYGIYTQIEQPNVSYLKNHGLDENGEFYKAEYFEFNNESGHLALVTDPRYEEEAFSDLIENKGKNNNHKNLLAAIDALNNNLIPIEDTLEQYFDEENLLKWMASQILFANDDTISRNYLLYSPPNNDKFYFIIYDCDGALKLYENNIRSDYAIDERSLTDVYAYQVGVTNYFGVVLFSRMFSKPDYVDKLTETIEWMRSEYITDEKILEMSRAYGEVIKPYRYEYPETIVFYHKYLEHYDEIIEFMPKLLDDATNSYYNSISGIAPFFVAIPEPQPGGGYLFAWNTAHSFAGLPVKYNLTVATDIFCENIIFEQKQLSIPKFFYEGKFPPGVYYIKVTADDAAGNSTYAQEYLVYRNHGTFKVYGEISFTVFPDGSTITTPEDYVHFTADEEEEEDITQ
jgi:spore coat protein H